MSCTAVPDPALETISLYVPPTPAIARELTERMARAYPASRCPRIPSPARVLGLLRSLERGNLLLVSGGGSSVHMEGFPDAAPFAGLLFACRWLEPAQVHRSGCGTAWWRLSEVGRRKLAEGVEWWRGLSRRERFWRCLADGAFAL